MRAKLTLLLIFFGLISIQSMATHNRAGEITYKHVSGFTYEITITTYTDLQSFTADRCSLEVFYGDGTSEFLDRVNGTQCVGNFPSCDFCGENIPGVSGTKLNKYVGLHTFPGTGTFRITMEDPNRNDGVVNIPNSIDVVFFVYAELFIFASGVPNSSPYLHYPPIDNGCLNQLYEHNPGAVDQDIANNGSSDSLTYSLVSCLGNGGTVIPNYSLPDQWPAGPNNNISIDSETGTLTWNSPKVIGEYNVAILIEEWRRFGNNVIKVGSVLRDIQISIASCDLNNPPVIDPVQDTCVTATEFLDKKISASDFDFDASNNWQRVELQAKGDPFEVLGNKASFPRTSDDRFVSQDFKWVTQCNHVRAYPYFAVFRASDNGTPINLTDYLDWRINVNAPAPTNIQAKEEGSKIRVTWDYNTCSNASGFRIYRKFDSIGYEAPLCETGIPASTGYTLVGSTAGAGTTVFVDDDDGNGLTIGLKYCYMVYAYFEDGAESYPSVESCTSLKKEVPLITRVSVNTTQPSNGSDTIKWTKPVDMDSTLFPGPYGYKVYRRTNQSSFTEIFSSSLNMDLNLVDSVLIDSNLNTRDNQHAYKIEVYSGSILIGPSSVATSPFLKTQPLDNRIKLSLDVDVPWTNTQWFIYKQDNLGSFDLHDSTSENIYVDSFLVNGNEYCYYVTTVGQYADSIIEWPLLNNSQIKCDTAKDTQAPCAPEELEVDSDCELFYNHLEWLNPNDICDTTDDVVSYNVYFRPFEIGESSVIATIQGAENTFIEFSELESVAGCYNVSAVDSFNNESELSNTVCVDNCPIYELPNIFTPGQDGNNDYFVPLKGWRYVERVDMHMYNRWGEEVYTTEDPVLGWDGSNSNGGQIQDGVYFYVCVVYEIRLQGIVERVLKGTVTLLREKPGEPSN